MAVALVSALGNHPVRHDTAMTGEITLTGRVLPIGGLKEKVLGAVRAGIDRIILPADNEGDLEDLPDHVREAMTFKLASTLQEALAFALADVELRDDGLAFSPNGRRATGSEESSDKRQDEGSDDAPAPAEPVGAEG